MNNTAHSPSTAPFDFDFLVVGSGFGGSVSAFRLTEKGYTVGVVEQGKRFGPRDDAKTNWDVRRYLWAPFFKCFGIQRLTFLKDVLILSGSGVGGGGSLVYAQLVANRSQTGFVRSPFDWAHFSYFKSRHCFVERFI